MNEELSRSIVRSLATAVSEEVGVIGMSRYGYDRDDECDDDDEYDEDEAYATADASHKYRVYVRYGAVHGQATASFSSQHSMADAYAKAVSHLLRESACNVETAVKVLDEVAKRRLCRVKKIALRKYSVTAPHGHTFGKFRTFSLELPRKSTRGSADLMVSMVDDAIHRIERDIIPSEDG